MNREIVLKNKDVFDHWLVAGNEGVLTSSDKLNWKRDILAISWDFDIEYIINDAFVEFRKIFVRNKILKDKVVKFNFYKEGEQFPNEWKELTYFNGYGSPEFYGTPEQYKIFDVEVEPEIKVNDYVYIFKAFTDRTELIGHTNPLQLVVDIDKDTLKTKNVIGMSGDCYHTCLTKNARKWEQKDGEWCLFNKNNLNYWVLARFDCTSGSTNGKLYWTKENHTYDKIQPYLGPIPQ